MSLLFDKHSQLNQSFNLVPWRNDFVAQRYRRIKQCTVVLVIVWLAGTYWNGVMYKDRLAYFAQAKAQLDSYHTDRVEPGGNAYLWHKRQAALQQALYAHQEQQWLASMLIDMANTTTSLEGTIQALSITRTVDKQADVYGSFSIMTPLSWVKIDRQLKLYQPWQLNSAHQPDDQNVDWRLEFVVPSQSAF